MSKPTPRPWRDAGEDGFGGIEFIRIEAGEETGPTNRMVAWVMSNGGPDYNHLSAEDRANAAHLIKCVNIHDELFEALKIIVAKRGFTMLSDCCVFKTCQPVYENGEQVAHCAFQWGVLRGFDECAEVAQDILARAEGRDE